MSDLHGVFTRFTTHYHQSQDLISYEHDKEMKLHILNDLHIEFENFDPPATDADVVILGGGLEAWRRQGGPLVTRENGP